MHKKSYVRTYSCYGNASFKTYNSGSIYWHLSQWAEKERPKEKKEKSFSFYLVFVTVTNLPAYEEMLTFVLYLQGNDLSKNKGQKEK